MAKKAKKKKANVKKKVQAGARLARKKVNRKRKDIDEKLINLASQSMDQLQGKLSKHSNLQLDKDIAKQLGEVILAKAQEIRKSLQANDLKTVGKKTKKKVVSKAKQTIKKVKKKASIRKKKK